MRCLEKDKFDWNVNLSPLLHYLLMATWWVVWVLDVWGWFNQLLFLIFLHVLSIHIFITAWEDSLQWTVPLFLLTWGFQSMLSSRECTWRFIVAGFVSFFALGVNLHHTYSKKCIKVLWCQGAISERSGLFLRWQMTRAWACGPIKKLQSFMIT